MVTNWDKIKIEILAETKEILEEEADFRPSEVLDVFEKTLSYFINESSLEGVGVRIPNALQKILLENLPRVDKNAYFPELAQIEPYLKKILFIVNRTRYEELNRNPKGISLAQTIADLGLNPNHISFHNPIQEIQRSHFAEHLQKAYQLRNIEAHECRDWNNTKLYNTLRSVLVVYLFATQRHLTPLKLAIAEYDFKDFLNQEIQRFRAWQKRFVHIKGKEEIEEIELYARELLEEEKQGNERDENFKFQQAREGSIDDLRKQIKEKQMVIVGEAGMGKSTTLQYLALKDAQNILQGNTDIRCPIYIELKMLTPNQNDIMTQASKKLNVEFHLAQKLFREGKVSLFLDGLNEVEKSIKGSIYTQIRNIIQDFPNIRLVLLRISAS